MKYQFDSERHIHSLDGKPLIGASTACKVVGPGSALAWWASGLACEQFGWLHPKKNTAESVKTALQSGYERIQSMSLSEYKKLLSDAYKAHSATLKNKAKEGTDLHAVLEDYVKGCMELGGAPIDYEHEDERVKEFIVWAKENVERFLWSEIHSYSETLWVGGITDVGMELKDGRVVVGDFKSSKDAYFNQFIQCALYQMLLEENGGYNAKGEKTFTLEKPIDGYAVIPFGAKDITPRFYWNTETGKECAKAVVTLYKADNAYKK